MPNSNYLNVEKQKPAAKSETKVHADPELLKMSLKVNEGQLHALAAAEKARRAAGGDGSQLAARLAALPENALPRQAKPNINACRAANEAAASAAREA